jgi:hypothetical protein
MKSSRTIVIIDHDDAPIEIIKVTELISQSGKILLDYMTKEAR